jgi:hypothetical protein
MSLSTNVQNYGDVFPRVGRTPSSARDAAVLMKNAPTKRATGPAAVQPDCPTLLSSVADSLTYCEGVQIPPGIDMSVDAARLEGVRHGGKRRGYRE